jgi:hypothetical protein
MMDEGCSDRIVARNEPGSELLSKPIRDERQSARFIACLGATLPVRLTSHERCWLTKHRCGPAPARSHGRTDRRSGRASSHAMAPPTAQVGDGYVSAASTQRPLRLAVAPIPPAVVAALAAPVGTMRSLRRAAVDAAITVRRPALNALALLGQCDRSLDRSALGAPAQDSHWQDALCAGASVWWRSGSRAAGYRQPSDQA